MHEQGTGVVVAFVVVVVAENVKMCQPQTQHEVIYAQNAYNEHKFSTNGNAIKIRLPKSAERRQLQKYGNEFWFYAREIQ